MTFNDHEGSTKSYLHTRKHRLQVVEADFVPPAKEITTAYDAGTATSVTHARRQLVRFTRWRPTETLRPHRSPARRGRPRALRAKGEVPTGLLFVDGDGGDMHDVNGTTEVPLSQLPFEKLCPGKAALDELQSSFR